MADRILVGVDGSPGSERALAWAGEDAAARRAVLEVVTVWQSPYDVGEGLPYPVNDDKLAAEAATRLDQTLDRVLGRGTGIEVDRLVVRGDPAPVLCDRSRGALELVVGSRGHSAVAGVLLGSVSMRCAHHSEGPVVIVPDRPRHGGGRQHRRDGRVVVGVDRSAGSRAALRWAIDMARYRGWTVEAVEAWQDPYDGEMSLEFDMPHFRREHRDLVRTAEERLAAFVADAAGPRPDVEIGPVLVAGEAPSVLCSRSAQASLLVVGAQERRGLALLVAGSVGSACAHRAECPTVIVRHRRGVEPTERSSGSAPGV